jgi:uncharacterized membrane protein YebE (DUF533 family)
MDPGDLVDGVLRSVLGGRRRRSSRALRYLTRGTGGFAGTLLSNPTALLTAAGVAWGIFETLQAKGSEGSLGSVSSVGSSSAGGSVSTGGFTGSTPSASLPPLPNVSSTSGAAATDDAMRIVRLAISAAQADGAINAEERAAIVKQAREAGVADILERELGQSPPLSEIVRGVTDPAQRATLYGLAFTVARADEQPGGAERIYLAQLANLLGLEPATVQQIEKDVAARIDSAGEPSEAT